jgi:hypothetical protein
MRMRHTLQIKTRHQQTLRTSTENRCLQDVSGRENQSKAQLVVKGVEVDQEESFKKGSEGKRLLRGNSHSHIKVKV